MNGKNHVHGNLLHYCILILVFMSVFGNGSISTMAGRGSPGYHVQLTGNPEPNDLIEHSPFELDGDGDVLAFFSGNGTSGNETDPHIIANISIDCLSASSGITIKNTDKYITIKNCRVFNASSNLNASTYRYDSAIQIVNASHVKLENSTFDFNFIAVGIYDSMDINVTGNTISDNYFVGIVINNSRIILRNNTFRECGVYLAGTLDDCRNQNIDDSNTLNGDGIIFYVKDAIGLHETIPAGSQVLFVNCSNIELSGHVAGNSSVGISSLYSRNISIIDYESIGDKYYGMWIARSENISLENSTITHSAYAVASYQSNRTSISQCNISSNLLDSLVILESINCTVSNNFIFNDTFYGIKVRDSPNTTVVENTASYVQKGVGVDLNSNGTQITRNNLYNNSQGIYLGETSNITIAQNTITTNAEGIHFYNVENSSIYLNNFINNTVQAGEFAKSNSWNSSFLGNYWSDYNESGATNDGDTWDIPYNITGDTASRDHHPLVLTNKVPSSDFSTNTTRTVENMDVLFQLNITIYDGPLNITWYFGNDVVNTNVTSISHKFTLPGTFTVKVIVEDRHGETSISTKNDLIVIEDDVHPLASVTCNATRIYRGDAIQITFTGSPGNQPALFTWLVNNETQPGNGSSISLSFTSTGIHNITLIIVDFDGERSTITYSVVVIEHPNVLAILASVTSIVGSIIAITLISKKYRKKRAWNHSEVSPPSEEETGDSGIENLEFEL
ncbi:MAG: NosD domain-containing protein [Promethearchaeota archaeon]